MNEPPSSGHPAGPSSDNVGEEAGELLLPPQLSPDNIIPLDDGTAVHWQGKTMGTGWVLQAVLPLTCNADVVRQAVEQSFACVIAQMSQWEPTSELSRFNAAAPGETIAISAEFREVLDCALMLAEASGGAFDPTLGEASNFWGFGASAQAAPGATLDHDPTCQSGHWHRLRSAYDENGLTQPGGLQLDLSGIAKGFAVDLTTSVLQKLGIHHELLEIGGEFRGSGVQQDGLPWWVDIEQPPASTSAHTRIGLTGWALATSGNYHRRRSNGAGESWSHTLDPETGRPLDDTVMSVSVLHPGCMQADALATILAVLGPQAGMQFARDHKIPARIVTQAGTASSPAWQAWCA
ncbi:FAD:protein FMN transferase [Altericroceibacterium endophyticum]|uniref:FAD:protein FMN transferase n=1 Tax=Altericroceibacterium endophyticum TaxID=1808508 RepID=A0A6I4T3W9_9SPHN|nr:FAD:protein FMN transferase [Altericroceibacterium endophyticum]MXO64962.1 FAD:protein FMN transferase [Altericroceibacterium endophyticum]